MPKSSKPRTRVTKTPSLKKAGPPKAHGSLRRPPRYRSWTFTINNPTATDVPFKTDDMVYMVYGHEHTAPDSGTPHYQGYCTFYDPQPQSFVKALPFFARAHLERARKNESINRWYCTKEKMVYEAGERAQPGRRKDWEYAKQVLKTTAYENAMPLIFEKFPHMSAHKPALQLLSQTLGPTCPPMELQLRDWQQLLENKLNEPPAERQIIFVCDPLGGAGKTIFMKYWQSKHPKDTLICRTVKEPKQVMYNFSGQKYIFFDFPRYTTNIPYDLLEEIKDGIRGYSMFGLQSQVYKTPHVVCFMNSTIDSSDNNLTADRYDIIKISKPLTMMSPLAEFHAQTYTPREKDNTLKNVFAL